MCLEIEEGIKLKSCMPNTQDVKNFSNFFYAFSDYTRLKIIILLSLCSLCVNDISMVLDTNQTTISHQLKILKSLNIVECDKCGKTSTYYLKNSKIEQLLDVGAECL